MDVTKFVIPKYLDAPERLFIFTYDEVLALFCPIAGGLVFNLTLLGLISSVLTYRGLKKLKARGGFSLVVSIIYWHGPNEFNNLQLPNYQQRYI